MSVTEPFQPYRMPIDSLKIDVVFNGEAVESCGRCVDATTNSGILLADISKSGLPPSLQGEFYNCRFTYLNRCPEISCMADIYVVSDVLYA